MSKNNKFKWREFRNKYLLKKNFIFIFFSWLLVIPFVLIYVYSLRKSWYDGLSVAGLLYICFGLLGLVFNIAQFKTWYKIKSLFRVKKENKEKLTNFEKSQMKLLNIKDSDEYEKEKKEEIKNLTFITSLFGMLYGLILLIISLPFFYI